MSLNQGSTWNLHWLGMFSNLPIGHDTISPLDALGNRMLDKLSYQPGERDMVVLCMRLRFFGSLFIKQNGICTIENAC